MSATFDVVIIGSGPGGYVAAIRAGQLGLKTAVVEKDARYGGTCGLRGCIPTKAMLESAEVVDRAREANEFGVLLENPRIDLDGVHKHKDKIVQQNAGGVAFLFKKNKVTVFQGTGRLDGAGRVRVDKPDGSNEVLTARNIILATGSTPRRIPNVEVDGQAVLTSDELLELRQMPEHLLVLGSGAVGVEFASLYRSFGCEVTVVELLDRLVPNEDEEVSKEFERVFKRRGIKCHTSTKLTAVERVEKGVRARLEPVNGQPISVTASHLLVAVGRAPVTEGLGLEKTKIQVERGYVKVDPYMRTAEPGVYAIGDIVAGTPQLAHKASAEGIVAVEHIAGLNPPPVDYGLVPGCTYSSPEIGSLGLTEKQAKDRGYDVKVGKFPFSAIGKARVIGVTWGFVKIVADKKYDQVLGVHIIGPRATDLIAEAGPLLKLECTVEELARTIHAHPTLAEAVHEAAEATLGHPIHI
jgi:dihydrolipoamide dehydrogenase